MSKDFEKFIAKQELARRHLREAQKKVESIQSLPDEELERILTEPDNKDTLERSDHARDKA